MTYERKQIKQINSTPSHSVKPRPKGSGIFRAVRRPKPSPAYLQGMQEWRDRVIPRLFSDTNFLPRPPCSCRVPKVS